MTEAPGDAGGTGDSGERSRAYRVVEGLHLRQWLARSVVPLALLAGNTSGLLHVSWLPGHAAPLAAVGLPPESTIAVRCVGVALVLTAAAVRVASKGVLVRRTTLTTGGIYARVRHPFYLGVVLGGLGTLLLAGALGAVVAVFWLLLAWPIYSVTIAGEEAGLAALYPVGFATYAARVPALIPRPGRRASADAPPTPVTFANLVSEHEPPRLLRFLGGALAVAGVALGGTAGWWLIGVGAVLFAASRALPGLRPPSRRAPPA